MAMPTCCLRCHSNLQEKLLGDLKHKLLWDITDTDLGCHPCNCPRNHKVKGVCAYGGNGYSCQTAGTVYKITCKANGCDCFYIGKSQRCVKKQVQEHIGEVAKIYAKTILPTNQQPARRMSSQPQTSTTSLVELLLDTQTDLAHESQPLCVIINNNASNWPREASTHAIRRANSNNSSITNNRENEPPHNLMPDSLPIINFCPIEASPDPPDPRQENCPTLARHLLSHIHHTRLKSILEVQEWSQSHINVNILWKLNTISLMNTAHTKLCHLCVAKRMTIGHNLVYYIKD